MCGVRLTQEELKAHGEPNCPKCGNDGTPCAPADDCRVELNWHELRILTIWAMNHAEALDGASHRRVVTAICKRLEKQHPDKGPLTMAGEFKEMREAFGNVTVTGMQDFEEFVEVNGPGAVGHVPGAA